MKYLLNTIVFFITFLSVNAQSNLQLSSAVKWLNAQNVRAAFEDMSKIKGYDADRFGLKVKELEELCSRGFAGLDSGDVSMRVLAERAVALKREILMSNPLLDGDKIIVGRYKIKDVVRKEKKVNPLKAKKSVAKGVKLSEARSIKTSALGTQGNNWTNQTAAPREGFNAEIAELSNLRGEIKQRTIFKPTNGSSVADLLLHWDAEKILFTATDEKKRWNVFEVRSDGSGFRKVINIDEPDLEFFDATYLPDGRFVAVSNIGYQGVPCIHGNAEVGNLVSYDPKTNALRRMTFDQDANWHPTVMNNGRLMYVRWEYTDLTHYCSRMVMQANPDGTDTRALYGSGSWFPNSTFDVKPIPGGNTSFVGIISGHHGIARSGRMMLFDPAKSRKEEKGMINEFPFSKRPIIPLVMDKLVDGVWPQFIKPYPINEKYYLVAAKPDPTSLWGIYLVDTFDNMTLVAEYEGEGLIQPILVKKRPVPPVIPDKIKSGDKNATIFIQDIYEGEGLPGVPRGTVKQLRVLAYEYAYLKSPSNHMAQGIQSGWDIKRLLGTVTVEADGSAIFKVPANTPISIQPLDSEGRALQWMRSWFTAMPGEIVSCVGCHEDQNSMPIPKRVLASVKSPESIVAPEGGVRPFTFDLEIQPILDRKCVACHDGKSRLDFRGGIKIDQSPSTSGSLKISTSYVAFHPYVNRQGPEADIAVMKPYEYHASTSEVVKILKRGHHNVQLDDKEWRTLYNWIDFNAPYHGAFDPNPNEFYSCKDQIARRIDLTNKYANNAGVDWQKETKDYAFYLDQKGKPTAVKPEPETLKKYKEVKVKGFPFKPLAVERKSIEIAPGVKINFSRIPAGSFVMGCNTNGILNAPASKVKIEKAFWMAETELTNEQYKVVFRQHDSRYIAQFWKDHVKPGYDANRPAQPVIRISWNEAMAYCSKLSAKIGAKVNLPTEAQWEWAARAGADSDFWFGNLNSDFAPYENMADKQLSKMAVQGVNPQPMKEDNPFFPFYNYLPRENSVDDGNMIVADVAKYEPSPWGLYDIYGNVEEWTRSDFSPYPYKDQAISASQQKVIRGGSWIDRPKNSTSYIRNSYYAWQPANNVGFRLIIED
jgi:formylglycine-generating enzyme required for sulfatase activity